MVRIGMTVRLLAVSALLTGVAFAGNAIAAPNEAGAGKLAVADAAQTSAVASTAAVDLNPCARKVKVVYAGYGEAARAGCNAAIATTN